MMNALNNRIVANLMPSQYFLVDELLITRFGVVPPDCMVDELTNMLAFEDFHSLGGYELVLTSESC